MADHRAALDAFLATAAAFDQAAWNAPRAAGKWSPAQTAEHLRLAYSTLLAELANKGGMRVRTSWWQRILFRLFYLRGILRTGRLPGGVRAVREIRPADGPYEQAATLDRLRREGQAFNDALQAIDRSRFRGLTHPYLGVLEPYSGLRFATIHIRHHHGQVL